MIQANQLTGGSLGSMVLGLAASLLALAVFVQVVQEIYKFLTSSKSRSYRNALRDYLGRDLAEQLIRSDALKHLRVRGPLDFGKDSKAAGWLLPLTPDSLKRALESTASSLQKRFLDTLTLETSLDPGTPPGSPSWQQLVESLKASGQAEAQQLLAFVNQWTASAAKPFDAAAMLAAFRAEFLAPVDAAVKGFPELMQQFDFAYRRRNLRQTFLLGFLVAFIGGFPIGLLYQRASRMSPEEAQALAQAATALKTDSMATAETDSTFNEARTAISLLRSEASGAGLTFASFTGFWKRSSTEQGEYLLGCLMTALLLSFGAPFWNDLTKSLMKLQKQGDSPARSADAGAGDG